MTNKKTTERFVVAKNLAKNLVLHRMWHGFSQTELADTVGVTFQQYQKWENCSNNIFADQLIRLCQDKKWDIATIVSVSMVAVISYSYVILKKMSPCQCW